MFDTPEVNQRGFLAAEPEARYSSQTGEISSVNFRVLSTKHWKDKDTGEPKEKTTGLYWTAFGPSAQYILDLLKKGSHVLIRGEVDNQSWEENGETRYRDAFIVRRWKLLDRKGSGEPGGGDHGDDGFGDYPEAHR